MKQKLVVIGNGMAGARAVEEVLARDKGRFDVVMFGILLYALLGKAADTATRGLEQWLLRWNPNYRQA